MILDRVETPKDLAGLSLDECAELAAELRELLVRTVSTNGGHLGSNLGAVELTIALHRVFSSPRDVLLFDTGHQSYVHKVLTGRRDRFAHLRRAGGLSGYPNRAESPHDVIENSHASTALSWAHGIEAAFLRRGEADRRVVSIVGDGALTGGLAYEALNNIGHGAVPVLIVLNDNGRSYAPTVSRLAGSHDTFFGALGIPYLGPVDGHDVGKVEDALRKAGAITGPVVLHVVTTKGKGYPPAEADAVACLHDLKLPPASSSYGESYGDAFSKALLAAGEEDPSIVAITAAMPGPTGLLGFEEAFPERFFDVGIAEQHAMTAAAGMAHGGLRPVLCVYSTFLQRCVDQWNLDVGLHGAGVIVVADRAGITGDDGPSHHGLYDMCSALSIPNVAIYAPAEPAEVAAALTEALASVSPALIRYPKTLAEGPLGPVGEPGRHRVLRHGDDRVVLVGIGKLARPALEAAGVIAEATGDAVTVVDPRVIRPADPDLVELMSRAELVVTVEDGLYLGGAGAYLTAAAHSAARSRSERPGEALSLGVPTAYLPQGKPDAILSSLGLDASGIAARVIAARQMERAGEPTLAFLAADGGHR